MKASRLIRVTGSAGCVLLAALLALIILPAEEESAGETPRPFVLPHGDASAGGKVFIKLECGSCHNVSGMESPQRNGEAPGPELTAKHAAKSRESIAGRLISYDRFLSEGHFKATYSRSDGSSRMGNFNDAMTVRELIDLVEYIKSIE